jgi:tRNA A-37 threonylcarbamoyl transferase component Bud32
LSAFENTKSRHLNVVEHPSPICPPTPLRTPFWHARNGNVGINPIDSDSLSLFLPDSVENLISMPPIMRQNSLEDNKLLLTQSDSPHGDVRFHRDFLIEGVLGSGTFAEVYKVSTKFPPKQFFAVKKLKRQFRSKKDRDWSLNEVRMMKRLGENTCPYVLPFVRAWQEDSYFYVQLGLAEKGSLKDIVSQCVQEHKLIPDVTVWHVLHDVSIGLAHIHRCGIVHLDIKPANLLIVTDGKIQIGDFGMASPIGSKEDGHEGDTRLVLVHLSL